MQSDVQAEVEALAAVAGELAEVLKAEGECCRDGRDGKDGRDGIDGKDGRDGKDAKRPRSYVFQVLRDYTGAISGLVATAHDD